MKTTTKTAYLVQSYLRHGRQTAYGQPDRMDDRPKALRRAEEIASSGVAVTVMEMEYDATVDYCGEPRVIASYGEMPEFALWAGAAGL